jgi:acetyl esterase/lipase
MASPELDIVVSLLRTRPADGEGEVTIAMLRQRLDAFGTMGPLPEGARVEPLRIGDLAAEWIHGAGAGDDATLLYLHGGGYALGSILSHRNLVARVSEAMGMRALLVEYRLAPEHPFPAGLDDACDVYRWLLRSGVPANRIVVAGDSAGGGLTMALLVALRDAGESMPAAAVVLSPWTDLEVSGETVELNAARDPMIHRGGALALAAAYLSGGDARHPLCSPIHADLRGLPPLLVHVGGSEVLLDDSRRLARRARDAGVDVSLEEWDDMIHVWHAFAPILPEATAAIEKIGAFARARVG